MKGLGENQGRVKMGLNEKAGLNRKQGLVKMGPSGKAGPSENGTRCVSIWVGRPIIAVPLFPSSVLPTVFTVHNSNDNYLDLITGIMYNDSYNHEDESDEDDYNDSYDYEYDYDDDDSGFDPGLNSPNHPYLVTVGKNYSGWPGENIRWP